MPRCVSAGVTRGTCSFWSSGIRRDGHSHKECDNYLLYDTFVHVQVFRGGLLVFNATSLHNQSAVTVWVYQFAFSSSYHYLIVIEPLFHCWKRERRASVNFSVSKFHYSRYAHSWLNYVIHSMQECPLFSSEPETTQTWKVHVKSRHIVFDHVLKW